MSNNIENFVGYVGAVGDEDFNTLTSLLEKEEVISEEEPVGVFTNFIETTYDIDGKHYMLWYEVRRPDTPRSVLKFGFDRVES